MDIIPPSSRKFSMLIASGLGLGGHESAGELLIGPTRRKGVGNLEPTAVISGTVIEAHAGTLALMTDRVLARRGAFFLLAIRLDNIDFAVFGQRPLDEIIEPGFRQFPVFLAVGPDRGRSPAVLKPLAVRFSKRDTHTQALPFSRPTQYDRYPFLPPDIFQRELVHFLPSLPNRPHDTLGSRQAEPHVEA